MKTDKKDSARKVARMWQFVEERSCRRSQSARIRWRQVAMWCLYKHFGFYQRDLSEVFGCSRMQVYRDLHAALFFAEHEASFRAAVEDLRCHIEGR